MKNILYIGIAVLGVSALTVCRDCPTTPKVMAAQATPAGSPTAGFIPPTPPEPKPVADPVPNVKGDLVIDFLGAVRGYVEPCG